MAGQVAPEPVEIEVEALTSEPYVDLTLDAIAELGGTRAPRRRRLLRPAVARSPRRRRGDGGGRLLGRGLSGGGGDADRRQGADHGAAARFAGRATARFVDLLERMGARMRWRADGLEVTAGPLTRGGRRSLGDAGPGADARRARAVRRRHHPDHRRAAPADQGERPPERHGAASSTRSAPRSRSSPTGWSSPGSGPSDRRRRRRWRSATWGDHRIAMSMALVGLRRPGVADPRSRRWSSSPTPISGQTWTGCCGDSDRPGIRPSGAGS